MLTRSFLSVLAAHFVAAAPAAALTITYTDSTAFLAALTGPAATLDFDSPAAGTLFPSGSTLDDVTFTYSIAGLTLKVTDAFDTTSGTNSLGLTGGDEALLDGDQVTLGFASPVNALGMFFITSDPIQAGEIQLSTSVGTTLSSTTVETTLADGGLVYFLGLVSTTAFSTALIDFAADGQVNFAYNVDDIITAVPEPGILILICLATTASWVSHRTPHGQRQG